MKLSMVVGGVMLAAVAAGLGGPYWAGIHAEKNYDEIIHEAAQNYGIDPKDAVYHRGWFTSSSRIKFYIPGAKGKNKSRAISLVSEIHHGPVVFGVLDHPVFAASVVVTTLSLPHDLDATLHYYFGDRPPLRMTTSVGFDGSSKTHISSPVYMGPTQDGKLTINWKGADGDSTSTVTSQGENVTSHIKVPGFLVKGQGGELEIKSIELSGHGRRVQSGIFESHTTASLAKFNLNISGPKGGDTQLSLSGLSMSDDLVPKAHMLSLKVGTQLDGLVLVGQNFGPAHYDMELRNISEKGAVEYIKMIRDMRNMQLNRGRRNEIMARLGSQGMALADEILKRSPQFEISRASLVTPQGEIAGRLLVTFDGDDEINMKNPVILINRVHAEANVEVPEMLFKTVLAGIARRQLTTSLKAKGQEMPDETTLTTTAMSVMEQEIQSMEDNGFIVNQGGHYTTTLLYDKGLLTVNGRPMGSQGL